MTKEQLIESMNEVENIFLSILNLKENLTDIELAEFYTSIIPYYNNFTILCKQVFPAAI